MIFTDEIITDIEIALGFELYESQVNYLKNPAENDIQYVAGKTTVNAIYKLLTITEDLSIRIQSDITRLTYDNTNHQTTIDDFALVLDVHNKLNQHGFKTCLTESLKKDSENFMGLAHSSLVIWNVVGYNKNVNLLSLTMDIVHGSGEAKRIQTINKTVHISDIAYFKNMKKLVTD